MKLIAGLGNVGKEYEDTRHNVGFLAVRWLADKWQEESGWTHSKQQAYIIKTADGNKILAQPDTMMNESGRAIRALMDYYKINVEDITVIHDDADLAVGEIRSVESSTTGAGHHGILSVIEHAGKGFKRIRIGIGRPDQPVRDISNYVLGRLSPDDKKLVIDTFNERLEALISR